MKKQKRLYKITWPYTNVTTMHAFASNGEALEYAAESDDTAIGAEVFKLEGGNWLQWCRATERFVLPRHINQTTK